MFFLFLDGLRLRDILWYYHGLIIVKVGDHKALLIREIEVDEGPLNDVSSHYLRDMFPVADPVEGLHTSLLLLVAEGEDEDQVCTE